MSISFALLLSFAGSGAAQHCPAPIHGRIPYDADNPPEHRIQLKTRAYRDGTVLWLGQPVTIQFLRDRLRSWRTAVPTPYLVLEYEEGIDCAALANLRRIFDEDGGCDDVTVCSEPRIPARARLIRRQSTNDHGLLAGAPPAQRAPTICDIARQPARYAGRTIVLDVTFASYTIDNSHVEARGCGRALGLEVGTIANGPAGRPSLFWELIRAYRQSTPERWYGVFARARLRIRRTQNQIFVLDVQEISGPRLVPVPMFTPQPPLPPGAREPQTVAATFRQPPPSGCAPRSVRPERRRPPATRPTAVRAPATRC